MIVLDILLWVAALFTWMAGAPVWVPIVFLVLAVFLFIGLTGIDISDVFDGLF